MVPIVLVDIGVDEGAFVNVGVRAGAVLYLVEKGTIAAVVPRWVSLVVPELCTADVDGAFVDDGIVCFEGGPFGVGNEPAGCGCVGGRHGGWVR